MHRLRTVTYLDVSAVAGHHAMPAALLFHFDINQHQGPTITSYKISDKIPRGSGENGDCNSFAIFSNVGHLEFSTIKFYDSEALESDHAAYEI